MRPSGHFRVGRNAEKLIKPSYAAADTEWDSDTGIDTGPSIVFSFSGRLRRQIVDRSDVQNFAYAEVTVIPTQEIRCWT